VLDGAALRGFRLGEMLREKQAAAAAVASAAILYDRLLHLIVTRQVHAARAVPPSINFFPLPAGSLRGRLSEMKFRWLLSPFTLSERFLY